MQDLFYNEILPQCCIATFFEMEHLNTFPPLSTDNIVSRRISMFALEICVELHTRNTNQKGRPKAHLPAGLCLAGIVIFKLLMLISIHSLSLPCWLGDRLQYKEQWDCSACITTQPYFQARRFRMTKENQLGKQHLSDALVPL